LVYISLKRDDLDTRNKKILNTINSVGKDNRKGYFQEKKGDWRKKELASIKIRQDKNNMAKEEVNNDPRVIAETNKFLMNLNNPSIGKEF